jgi:hypothetical protein
MRIYTENGIRIIEAESGAFVTDGASFSEKVYLGKNASESAWRDATAEEKAEWEAMQNEPIDEQEQAEALTRYANELTGQNDPDLISAAETLIKQRTKE